MRPSRLLATLLAAAFLASQVLTPAAAAPPGCVLEVGPVAQQVFEVDETDVFLTVFRCGSPSVTIETERDGVVEALELGPLADGNYEAWSGAEVAGEYRVRAVAEGLDSGWVPLTILAIPTVNSAGWKAVGEPTNTWGRVSGNGSWNIPVWTEFWVNGRWSRSQVGRTGDQGAYVLPLTYGTNTSATHYFRVGAQYESGRVIYSDVSFIDRVARPTTHHVGTKIVGEPSNVWGRFDVHTTRVWTEVWTGTRFSRSQVGTADAQGNYVLPLTYGANRPDFYWFRVAGDMGGGAVVYSEPFYLRRVKKPTLNAPSVAKLGATTWAWGHVDFLNTYGDVRVSTQVWTGRGWSTSQTRTAQDGGYYAIPLTYGANAPGTTTWRVIAEYDDHVGRGRVESNQIRLTRVR